MQKIKYVVTTENGYEHKFDTMKEAIEDANTVEDSISHPIAFIHKESTK